MDAKELLSEMLDFWRYKLDHNDCTMSDAESVSKILIENLELDGSIKDFAEFYGVSESNVRATISRKVFAKPKRKVLYPFRALARVVPSKWRKDK